MRPMVRKSRPHPYPPQQTLSILDLDLLDSSLPMITLVEMSEAATVVVARASISLRE
jgi:hypothetical protein